jgi:putative acetyltransferase
MLVRAGLEKSRLTGCPFVNVLGHPEYYPRFGFVAASKYGFSCQWPGVPDEAFMILIFNREILTGIEGVIRYRPEFEAAMCWQVK